MNNLELEQAMITEEVVLNEITLYPGDMVFVEDKEKLYVDKETNIFIGSLFENKDKLFYPFIDDDVYLYIGVNKELNMSGGKSGAQIAHAVKNYMHNVISEPKNKRNHREYTTILRDLGYEKYFEQCLYEKYRIKGQKTITLGLKEKDLLKYESLNFISIRDNGLTEIPANSLTAVCFGITPKHLKPKYLNRYQLYK